MSMSNGRLDQVIEEVKLLSPDEQIAVRNVIDEILGERRLSGDEALQKKLMDKGLLSEIKPPVKGFASRPQIDRMQRQAAVGNNHRGAQVKVSRQVIEPFIYD